MKKIQYILGGMAIIALPSVALAQTPQKDPTVNRTVVVEQEYNPDIMDASKVNVLPKVEPPTVSKKEVEYAIAPVPAGEIPATIMQPYTGKETQQKAQPGYVRLGYGNYGNLDARANYLFTLPNSDRLNLTFSMDGMNGKLDLSNSDKDWKSYYYRTHAGVDYVHAFKKMSLNAAGNFDLSNFNLLYSPPGAKQKFTAGDVHLEVKSTSDDLPLQFRAETNLLLYERQYNLGFRDIRENIIRTKAEVSGLLSEGSIVGIDFAMDNVLYRNNDYSDYTSLTMTPHYRFENDDWKIRLGVHTDMAFGFGRKFQVSPDIAVQYTFSDSYILYAQAKGGRLQNDFRRLESFCPYGQTASQPDATYEQLNTALGFKASPLAGLWLNLYGGYQKLKDDLYFRPMYDNSNGDGAKYEALGIAQWNTSNFYAGSEVSYAYKDIVSFSASGTYRNWDASGENINQPVLLFKPSFETNFHVSFRPLSALLVNIGYQNISRTKMDEFEKKAAAISNLYLGGSYEIFKGISAYVRANNLLNKSYQYYWGHPTEGANFTGGVSFLF